MQGNLRSAFARLTCDISMRYILTMHWRITHVFTVGRSPTGGEYSVQLEAANGQRASAGIDAWWNRERSAGGAFDPAVAVLQCSDAGAREWLSAPEHEYLIAAQLLARAA